MQERLKAASPHARHFGTAFQGLSLYVSAAIAACGWGTSRLLEFDAHPYLLLWFAGSVVVYNVDRLKPDPADPVNIPLRNAAFHRFRPVSRTIIAMAFVFLIGIPIFMRNWWLLIVTLAAAFIGICYSLRFLGFRLKDVPLLKSFFAPSIAVAAFLFPQVWQGFETRLLYQIGTAQWLWMFLCFNMILCDLRDIQGDRLECTLTVPVLLGEKDTGFVLRFLVVVTLAAGLFIAWNAPEKLQNAWITLTLMAAVYQCHLLRTPEPARNESFYEWQVEGMLFIPALAVLVCRA